jgi:integrase
MARKKKGWSYNAGERGKNWVRAYEDGQSGRLYLEWMETVAETDPDTGEERRVRRRRRAALVGVTTRTEARRRAELAAERLGELALPPEPAKLTLAHLLTRYLKEVTPGKGAEKQGHDRRAARLWTDFFNAQEETDRHMSRHPSTLDRIDWDRFIAWRREGRIPGRRRVKDRAVEYDLKFMVAALGWATGAGEGGRIYLERHPWSAEVRRAQKWELPKELNPHRPAMMDDLRDLLIKHSNQWQFEAALRVARSTVSRNSSVRHLRWSDLDLEKAEVRWRGEYDKSGREVVVPLRADAVEALRRVPVRGIGEAWVFPAAADPAEPTSRHTFQTWLRRAKAKLLRSIKDPGERERMREQLRGLGYHGEKRAGVRDAEFRALPQAIQEVVSRTTYETLKDVYDDVTVDDVRQAMEVARRVAGNN